MIYTKEEFRNLFQSQFDIEKWFGFLHDFFHAENIRKEPERIEGTSDSEQGYYLANTFTSDSYNIGFFYYKVNDCDVARRKVSLRTLVRSFINPKWGEFEGVLVVFDDGRHWRLSFVSDIKGESTSPKRYTYVFGNASNVYNTPISRFSKLQETGISYKNILDAFSVEALSKDFYNDLYSWYQWALREETGVSFPNNPENVEDDRENINIKLIRLITRLLFVWFIKQKKLVPEDIFNVSYLEKILKNFSATSSEDGCYYNAILQNLFFATLNCAILDEDSMPRRFAEAKSNRDTRNLYRYDEMFGISKTEIVEIFAQVPFLNGGLFECLDRPKGLYTDTVEIFYDGFSRNATKSSNGNYKYRAFVPNILFFNEDERQPGLINLLKRYNFTIEENKANDAEISLDPELLGRVFENLLAAYNPETQESARKTTGSFYTPRPIVDFMVNEALKSYILNAKINGIDKEKIDTLFSEEGGADGLDDTQKQEIISTLKSVKILDPACGSGAFPMGCLLRIVDTIEKLSSDPIDKYSLKLEIIENCIYGVDIQPIAMLICKLRFFISLICEQKEIDHKHPESNFGINTLPNLETKFVAANSLIKADIRGLLLDKGILKMDEELRQKQRELLDVRKAHFMAKGRSAKKADEREDEKRRKEIQDLIVQKKRHADQKTIADCEKSLKRLKEEANLYKEEIWEEKKEYFSPDLFSGKKEEKVVRFDKNKTKRETTKKKIQEIEREIATEKEKEQTKGFEKAIEQITKWNPYDQNSVSDFLDPEWMFCMGDDKFDIVIGNPPYISTKGVTDADKKRYEKEFGFSDDTYNLFTFKGLTLCKDGGSLSYITPKTFWTTQTKRNMRDLLLSNTIEYVFDTANPFETAMVDTCITQTLKTPMSIDHKVRFFDGTEDLQHPVTFSPINQQIYINTQNAVIFKPTPLNLRIYELYGEKVKKLYDKWWDKIKTSRDIDKNKKELEAYRASLRPGDVALLGCLTEGGQGLATANNGKYIAVRRSTKWANNIMESRPKKLAEVIKKKKIKIPEMDGFNNEYDFLQSLDEKEIACLFDRLKETYGRDIFGQGYIYKIIEDTELADIDTLTEDEKINGISTDKNYYVPYDKGDKDGNRWYLETPFAIAWSKENVQFLKTNSGKKGEGMPVVRNPQFYFREGFCWSDINTTFLKCRKKNKSIHDVKSMSLFSLTESVSEEYIILLINSSLISYYVDSFVNNTQTFQINDARQLPVIIPTKEQQDNGISIFTKAYYLKHSVAQDYATECAVEYNLKDIEKENDRFVNQLYDTDF